MIERPAKHRVLGVKGAEHAASHSRIESMADTLKQLRRVRPRNIVVISGNDRRPLACRRLLADDQDFSIAFFGIPLRFRRSRMDSVKIDPLARGEPHGRMDGRDVRLDQEADHRRP